MEHQWVNDRAVIKAGDLRATERGVPVDLPTVSAADAVAFSWRPAAGDTALPILTLDHSAFLANRSAMFAYAAAVGAEIAPHAKTPMSPALAADLLAAGAFGFTVADARQALVLLESGFDRLILANQIGGKQSAARFGRMLSRFPAAQVTTFVDSVAAVESLVTASVAAGRDLGVLVEVGGARGGARSVADVRAIVAAVCASTTVRLAGVAAYEGASATAEPSETRRAIAELHDLARQAFSCVRAAAPREALILSSGGSAFFDLAVEDLASLARADGNTRLVLRSGAIFFHDHGVYARGLAAMDQRGGFAPAGLGPASVAFRPALRLWAEVLTRPLGDLAICGMGMRDVSFDQGLPRPLALWRDGAARALDDAACVVRLNDQHAFLKVTEDSDVAVGDIIEFGISHPCTCLDRWRRIFELDESGAVHRVLPTFFG
jgi:D-serine dehydratase